MLRKSCKLNVHEDLDINVSAAEKRGNLVNTIIHQAKALYKCRQTEIGRSKCLIEDVY